MPLRSLCVFCGSSDQVGDGYRTLARQVGALLGRRGLRLVYGGASVGLMGALADAARSHGATVLGVIPTSLRDREIAHTGIDELRVVDSLHERKALMAGAADAFLALPGGFGTMDELFDTLTWRQVKLHRKRVALLNHGGFYDPLLAWVARAAQEGFVYEHMLDAIEVVDDAAALDAWIADHDR